MKKKDGWEMIAIDDCFESIRNGANIRQNANHGGIPITRIETISNSIFNRDRLGYANITDSTLYSKYILNDGDILMSHINSPIYLGRAVLYKKLDDEEIIHGMNLLNLISKKDIVIPQYITYYFCSEVFKSQISRIAKKSVNQASFTVSDLKKIKLPVPPPPIQYQIISELDVLSNIIAKKKQQLEDIDRLAQATFYDMFGDPVNNEKGWDVKKLGDLGNFKNGLNYKNSETGINIKILSVSNFKSNIILRNLEQLGYVGLDNEPNEDYYLKDNDIVFVRSNGSKELVGRCLLLEQIQEKITFSGFCIRFRLENNGVNPLFLIYILTNEHFKSNLIGQGRGANISNVNQQMLAGKVIILPPISIQENFIRKIESIEKQKKLINMSINEVQQLFDYTMDKYFN